MARASRALRARKSDEPRAGLGARYSMRMHVGSADVGGLVEIVEFDEPADLAWTSVTGIDQRVRWRLRETDDGAHAGDAAACLRRPRRGARSGLGPGLESRWWRATSSGPFRISRREIEGGADEVSDGT